MAKINPKGPQYSPYIGYLGAVGTQGGVIDGDMAFTSKEGLAYRHLKKADGSEYWDELLYASQATALTDRTAPLNGGRGAQYPT